MKMDLSRVLLVLAVVSMALLVANLISVLVLIHKHQTQGEVKNKDDAPLVNVDDFHAKAKKMADWKVWTYLEEGCGREQTLRDNVRTFQKWRLLPYMMSGLHNITTSTTILGHVVTSPIGVAPTAFQGWIHKEGEKATARAIAMKGGIGIYAIASTYSMEDIAEAAPAGTRWQHIHYFADMEVTKHHILRAEKAGFSALVVTVDHYHSQAVRYEEIRHPEIKYPLDMGLGNFPSARPLPPNYSAVNPAATWDYVKWIKNQTFLPIVVKGVLQDKDALKALEVGAKAIVVSNHGGRTVDGVPAAIDVLPEIVRAVKGRAEVYMDGGVRTGMDVAKAIAFGARAVFIGRPVWYGLAVDGQGGVGKILDILQKEFYSTMLLLGANNPGKLNQSVIRLTDGLTGLMD